MIEEEGVVALLEEDELIEETILEEGVIGVEIKEHLHAFV